MSKSKLVKKRQLVNCDYCGKFVGKGGYIHLFGMDDVPEIDYAECAQCLDKKKVKQK